MTVKEAFAAGKFYTSDKEELLNTFKSYESNHKRDYNVKSRCIIVPHAGYQYSGQLAFDGFSYLDNTVKNVFVFAPTHRKSVNNLALSSCDEFETPLGNIKVNKSIQEEIIKEFGCEYCNEAFAEEHAIEVQIPFIQHFLPEVNIVGILIGNDDIDKTLKIISKYYPDKNNAFVVSTDLSHYLKEEDAIKIDTVTAGMIENSNLQGFRFEQACGAIPMVATSEFARRNDYSLIRVGMTNSGQTSGDHSKVVGYGSWFLYEGTRNDFVEKNFSPKLISIVRKTIESKLNGKSEINITSYMPYPPVFDSTGAVFVTLEIDERLRGCIGSPIAHTSLLIDLIKNSYNAAFSDPRFRPLTKEEYDKISISVSILSNPAKMNFKDEEDLLNQMRPNIDGIIIRDGEKQALYLPSVWKQLPDKKDFLNTLKQKAGMEPDHFSDTFEAYRFVANYIEE
ncbi:MAG: AmmeMemoRadiSam system protein B [bacterium]|nr:AmmeMemoRadiSam system protein B [bacterium]